MERSLNPLVVNCLKIYAGQEREEGQENEEEGEQNQNKQMKAKRYLVRVSGVKGNGVISKVVGFSSKEKTRKIKRDEDRVQVG
jgi:hypothetical protein